MVAQESDKAVRYLQQLDEARCAGNWGQVPELCRKVEKHAPHRKCLTLTARAEAQIATHVTQRPTTAASNASSGLSSVVPSLLSAIEEGEDGGQEAFQATVCLGWLHYILEEPALAVGRLPNDFGAAATHLSASAMALSGWTRVCLVKGTYVKASALEKTGAISDAVATFTSIIPWLAASPPPGSQSVQLRMWTEHLLIRLCQLSDQTSSTADYVEPLAALQTYRSWARFWEGTVKSGASDTKPRRLAWQAYFNTLSIILRYDMEYEPDTPPTQEKPSQHDQLSVRMRQRAELKRVETVYESLLIKETKFPSASETNQEIEAWVDAVIDNWRLLCGPTWSSDDLGEGGKEGIARSVLDILYRAATKTYHSTLILRYLFIVHASLAEFDLAFKAYDSYVEIITRGKDRAERTGHPDVGIDDDSTILRTSAEAIRLLCRYGCRKEAEKALEISQNIEKWLEQSQNLKSGSDAGSTTSDRTQIELTALAVACCAIGVSQAHWARLTYHVEKRPEIQAKAVQYLRKSLTPDLGDPDSLEAMYALALVLAETRDISGAIKIVKRALSTATKNNTTTSSDGLLSTGFVTEFGRERKLIPFWHLLALLLTSRSDYPAAEKACEAAFQQFGDTSVLFGTGDSTTETSQRLNQSKDAHKFGIVDRMEGFEKISVLQIKMTQLALLELTDGPSVAVDGSDELLSLYGRLFNDPMKDKVKIQAPAPTPAPPKSAVGTIRGSIFRGRDSMRIGKDSSNRNSSAAVSVSGLSTSGTQVGEPPAIQVINDENRPVSSSQHHRHHLFHHRHEDNRSSLGRTSSKLKKRSSSARRSTVSDAGEASELPDLPEGATNGSVSGADPGRSIQRAGEENGSTARKSFESGDRTLRPVAHNMVHASNPVGDTHQATKQDVRLPTPMPGQDYITPGPHFSTLQERRQKVTLLNSIWIFISGLYTRAQMFEDAKEAADEAYKLVETFESEASLESSTAKSFSEKGWGGGKSVEELWGDMYAARGELQAAQSLKHDAKRYFERALLHFPDHPEAIVGLSNILLDIYEEIIPFEPQPMDHSELTIASPVQSKLPAPQDPPASKLQYHSHIPSQENQISPPELNRLAARDRAYGLLSTLTKLGAGWDYSEAWYALSRAYEESGQIDKTKEVLWWCVELEDTRPLREWRNVNLGGYVL